MASQIKVEAGRAILAERDLQEHYRKMAHLAISPKIRGLMRDLLITEEMNELLLRAIKRRILQA